MSSCDESMRALPPVPGKKKSLSAIPCSSPQGTTAATIGFLRPEIGSYVKTAAAGALLCIIIGVSYTPAAVLFAGGNFIFKVTHIADHPPVGFPHNPLPDSCFKPVDTNLTHRIRFSTQNDTVFIDTTIFGVRKSSIGDTAFYELFKTFAGGSFIVRQNGLPPTAEFTLYGSGVPVIWSHRGELHPVTVSTKLPMNIPRLKRSRNSAAVKGTFLLNGRKSRYARDRIKRLSFIEVRQ